jgi:hypothetical protein
MSPEKGPHIAIEIAKRVSIPLKMAGKVDKVDVEKLIAVLAVLM